MMEVEQIKELINKTDDMRKQLTSIAVVAKLANDSLTEKIMQHRLKTIDADIEFYTQLLIDYSFRKTININ